MTFTKEQLIEHIKKQMKNREMHIASPATEQAFREYLELEIATNEIAIAALESRADAEPAREFLPKNLDRALGVVGVALPESREEFNLQSERWIQRLIDRVIRYADEFKEQPAPVVPDTLPCPGLLEPGMRFGKGVRTQTMLDALQRRAEYYAELEAMAPEQRAEHDAGIKDFAAMLQGKDEPVSQPYKLVGEIVAWNHPTEERRVDFRWIDFDVQPGTKLYALNSPVIPDCWCNTCRPVTMTDSRFVVCPECGNKRCPHANDHRNACTGSNEPGQEGNAYPAAPQQEAE